MIKLCFIDVETTGLDAQRNGIHQLAGQMVDYDTADGYDRIILGESFNYNIKPFMADRIDDKALKVCGVTTEQIMEYESPHGVYGSFADLCNSRCDKFDRTDKMMFVGYNAIFDYNFMRAWFEKNSDKYFGSFFHYPPIDVMGMAAVGLMEVRHELHNFKLGTVAEYVGIEAEGELHDADVDIDLTKQLFFELYKG